MSYQPLIGNGARLEQGCYRYARHIFYAHCSWKPPATSRAAMLKSIPLQSFELLQVHVSTAQHAHHLRPSRRFHKPIQNGRDRRGGCAFSHQLAVMHDPDQRIEDVRIGQRYNLVDELTHRVERMLAYSLDPKPVDYAFNLVERDQMAALDAQLHRRGA